MRLQKLVSTALIGIVVGVCFALPILIIATQNIITGLLATGVIVCITTSVIGLLPLAGWKLGVRGQNIQMKSSQVITDRDPRLC